MATTVNLIGKKLYEAGIRYAFGIPGGEVLTLINELKQVGIEFVLTKHENSAGFMAEGTWHAAKTPGLLIATLGPGVANAVNVIANAQQDRVPLIFITGCVDAKESATYTHQIFDHQALLRPVTKASFTIVEGAVDVIMDKAISIALDDPPGPVHVDLPIRVAESEQPVLRPAQRAPVFRGAPGGSSLAKARQWFQQAKRPLVIAGIEVLNHSAEKALADFVRQHRLPLITTYKAKGLLPEDHPLSLGGAGISPKADELFIPFLAQSDLIILAGYDPIEMRGKWKNPWPESTHVIELCSRPNTHYMHQATLSFVGDVGAGLVALGEGMNEKPIWPEKEVSAVRSKLRAAFAAGPGWGPGKIIETARRVLPRNTVATVDSGAHRILLNQMWECYEPRTLLQSMGLCTMGCALPLAAGYKRVNRDRPVVAFTGDAGLEMVLGELATVRDSELPIIVVVFVDETLALIEMKQRKTGFENVGVDFSGTDFVKIASAFEMHGALVADETALEQELTAALARRQSTILACKFPRKAYDGTF